MPRKLSRGTRLLTTAGIAAVAALAVPAAASAAECEPQLTTPAFAQFGDGNEYFLAPGGEFESLDMWSVRGTPELVAQVNPLSLAGGEQSVHLGSGDRVTSVSFCVDRTMPHMRFTARALRDGQLDVTVTTRYDGSSDSSSGSVSSSGFRAWAPSRNIELKTTEIPAGEQGTATVQFRSQGDWLLDDVYVDPYRR